MCFPGVEAAACKASERRALIRMQTVTLSILHPRLVSSRPLLSPALPTTAAATTCHWLVSRGKARWTGWQGLQRSPTGVNSSRHDRQRPSGHQALRSGHLSRHHDCLQLTCYPCLAGRRSSGRSKRAFLPDKLHSTKREADLQYPNPAEAWPNETTGSC